MSNLTSYVCEILIDGILHGKYLPGDRLLAEREFAEAHSVSRITVRRAFARLEEAGILVRKRPFGTYVADKFHAHSGDLKSIGLITALSNDFSGSFIQEVSSCCEKEDILLALGIPEQNTLEYQLKIAVRMASRGVKNLIVWGAGKGEGLEVFKRLRILGVNLVFYDQVIPGDFADYVGLDNKFAMESIFEAALKCGRKNFIFLNYSDLEIDSADEREKTFKHCLLHSGMPGEIIKISFSAPAAEKKKYAEIIKEKMNEDTALIAMNAPLLCDIFHSAPPYGALFCIDYTPALEEINATGFAQPIRAMAFEAVDMLKKQCAKGKKWHPVCHFFKGTVI